MVISRDLELGGKSSLGVSGSSGKDHVERVFGMNLCLIADVLVVVSSGSEKRMGDLIMRVRGGAVLLKMVVRSRDL